MVPHRWEFSLQGWPSKLFICSWLEVTCGIRFPDCWQLWGLWFSRTVFFSTPTVEESCFGTQRCWPVPFSLLEMTLLSSQSSSPVSPSGSVSTENPEQRMLEKRAKVVEELHQTERDYIRDLEMCIERIMVPLQQAQVGTMGESSLYLERGSPSLENRDMGVFTTKIYWVWSRGGDYCCCS